MKKVFAIFAFQVFNTLFAQYAIGTIDLTLTDASRSRDVIVELYYPATSAGASTPVASGTFPLITFGHGFVMGVDAYYNLKDSLVPKGYIFALVDMETSFSPNHGEFGADLLFVNNEIKARAISDNTFILYQDLNGKSAIMGHSMGGGATMLAGGTATSSQVTCLVGMAAAETTPSAISACGNITVPTMIFCASNDGVTPIADHQQPMYNAINACKFLINITGGAHCYYANTNLACDFGESVSSTGISITRAEQQQTTFRYLNPFLDYFLNDNASAWSQFNSQLTNTSESTNTFNCNLSVDEIQNSNFEWILSKNILTVSSLEEEIKSILIYDMNGKIVYSQQSLGNNITTIIPFSQNGMYVLNINHRTNYKLVYLK